MDRLHLEELCPADDPMTDSRLSTGGRLASRFGTLGLDEEDVLNDYHRLRPPLTARFKCKSKSAAVLRALTREANENNNDNDLDEMQPSSDQNVVYASFWDDDEDDDEGIKGEEENPHLDRTVSWMSCIYYDNEEEDNKKDNMMDISKPMFSLSTVDFDAKENVAPSITDNDGHVYGKKRSHDASVVNELRDQTKRIPLAPMPLEDFPTSRNTYLDQSPKKKVHIHDSDDEYNSDDMMSFPTFHKGKERAFATNNMPSSPLSYRSVF